MKLFLGFLASCLTVTTAYSQGLLGQEYSELRGGYIEVSGLGETLNGFGVAASVNAPMITDRLFGMDFNGGIGYARLSDSDLSLSAYGISGVFRGYLPVGAFFAPYAEAGLGWSRSRVSVPGERVRDSGFDVPVGAGAEFVIGAFSLTPFFSYIVGLDGRDDVWAAGAKAAYWITPDWGMTVSAAYTEFDNDIDGFEVILGFIFAFAP